MGILKHVHYIYLFIAIVFLIDFFHAIIISEPTPWLRLFLALIAIFMFFFRRKYNKKFGDRYNNRKP